MQIHFFVLSGRQVFPHGQKNLFVQLTKSLLASCILIFKYSFLINTLQKIISVGKGMYKNNKATALETI